MTKSRKSRRATVQPTTLDTAPGVSPVMEEPSTPKGAGRLAARESDRTARDSGSPSGRKAPDQSRRPGRSALPDKAGEDEAVSWGERPESAARDEWLKELKDQRPPHWG